jgi:arsenical pump membrane protein
LTLLLALLSLAVVLAFAVARPRGWPEAFAAVPAVVLLIAVDAISMHDAAAEAGRLSRVVAFLGAVLVPFLVFVLALGVVVQAVMQNGVAERMGAVLPSGSGLPALLGFAVVAAVLANVVNNLPATLVLVPLVASSGPAAVLAVLIGVNIGPNLTYVGSLSNLLWRSVLRRYDVSASVGEYTRLGLCTVPTALVAAVLALWAGVRLLGL